MLVFNIPQETFEYMLKSSTITKLKAPRRGYTITYPTLNFESKQTMTIVCAPDQKGVRALKEAYNSCIRWVAKKWDYRGSLAPYFK